MTHSAPARAAARSLAVPATGTPAVLRVAPSGRLVAAVALVALIGTGCSNTPAETGSGGGEKSATAGSSSTETGGDQSAPAGATPSPAELEERRKSAKCMRENGVEDFPDPDANGHILYYGDDPDMESASAKCDERQPGDRVREPGSGG
jgi:hypothetical protein